MTYRGVCLRGEYQGNVIVHILVTDCRRRQSPLRITITPCQGTCCSRPLEFSPVKQRPSPGRASARAGGWFLSARCSGIPYPLLRRSCHEQQRDGFISPCMRWKKLWDENLVVRVCANGEKKRKKSHLKAVLACKAMDVNLAPRLQALQG